MIQICKYFVLSISLLFLSISLKGQGTQISLNLNQEVDAEIEALGQDEYVVKMDENQTAIVKIRKRILQAE